MTREAPVRTEPHPTTALPRLRMSPSMELVCQSTQRFTRVHVARQDDTGSPVRTEPHPTRSFALVRPELRPLAAGAGHVWRRCQQGVPGENFLIQIKGCPFLWRIWPEVQATKLIDDLRLVFGNAFAFS
jgi:hypothetical protein